MRRIIWYFLILLFSIWLGIQIYKHPGYVLITYQHWMIESTLWFMILLLLLLFFILYFLIRSAKNIRQIPEHFQEWRQEHVLEKSLKRLHGGWINLLQGEWKRAEKLLAKSAKKDLAVIGCSTAAVAAAKQNAYGRSDAYLKKAKKADPDAEFALQLAKTELLLQDHRFEEALIILEPLKLEKPRQAHLNKLIAKAYLGLKNWRGLQKLLPDLKKSQALDEEEYLKIERTTYLQLLLNEPFRDYNQLKLFWKNVPKALRSDNEILKIYVMHLIRLQYGAEAEELIRHQLKKSHDPTLIEIYVKTPGEDPAKQLAVIENFIRMNPDDPLLLYHVGTFCIRHHLWGQAKEYLELSLKLRSNPKAYLALGYVIEKLGDEQGALEYYHKGLVGILI